MQVDYNQAQAIEALKRLLKKNPLPEPRHTQDGIKERHIISRKGV